MIFNKKRRIEYLGFNDFWVAVFGIIVLSFVTDYLFSNSFVRYELNIALINWSVSLFFSTTYWITLRAVVILLRKRFPDIKDVGKRVTILVISIVLGVIIIDATGNYVLAQVYAGNYNPLSRLDVLIPIIFISSMVMAIYEAVYFLVQLKESIRKEEQSKQAVVQAQLDALRNQAQPHFFFNSLNTLRDIIDQNPREDAKEFVDKLADVYRFILESGNVNLISLQDELKYAEAYIHIQKERFGDNLNVHWNVKEESLQRQVIPMSLQLLLENAIKHNVVSKAKPLSIYVNGTNETLEVRNKVQPKSTKIPSTQMGLKNIDQRYQLMSEKHIEIKQEAGEFIVSLPLLTNSELG